MKNYSIILLIIVSSFLFNCERKTGKTGKTKNISLESVITKEQSTEKKDIVLNSNTFKKKDSCFCKMSKLEGRYSFVSFKNSLTDNQKELIIKLCEKEEGVYVLSVESWIGYDENKQLKTGKIYDCKTFKIIDNYLAFSDEGCKFKTTKEDLFFIQKSKGIHSVWRISNGKLIELDKGKEYPCIDYEEMEYE